jgi:hypothetical protein
MKGTNKMDFDREIIIFAIAVVVFFICPIGLVVAAVIEDKRSRSNGQMVHRDQWSIGPLTNDQPRQ